MFICCFKHTHTRLWIWGYPGLHNEFQATQGYIVRLCLKKINTHMCIHTYRHTCFLLTCLSSQVLVRVEIPLGPLNFVFLVPKWFWTLGLSSASKCSQSALLGEIYVCMCVHNHKWNWYTRWIIYKSRIVSMWYSLLCILYNEWILTECFHFCRLISL